MTQLIEVIEKLNVEEASTLIQNKNGVEILEEIEETFTMDTGALKIL